MESHSDWLPHGPIGLAYPRVTNRWKDYSFRVDQRNEGTAGNNRNVRGNARMNCVKCVIFPTVCDIQRPKCLYCLHIGTLSSMGTILLSSNV